MKESLKKYFKKIKRVEIKFCLKDLELYNYLMTWAKREGVTLQEYIKMMIVKEIEKNV